jgi:hypothetical protein
MMLCRQQAADRERWLVATARDNRFINFFPSVATGHVTELIQVRFGITQSCRI